MRPYHLPAIVVLLIASCGWTEPKRYPNRRQGFDRGISLHSVYADDETLVYAFAVSPGIPVVDTNDPKAAPSATGVHWCNILPDGLWIDGRKVTLPQESKVFAIRDDRSIVPIEVSAEEMKVLADEFGRITDRGLNVKLRAALESTSGAP